MVKEGSKKRDVKQVCKEWGIGLIIAGIIPFIFSDVLSTSFGIFAILLGVLSLIFRKKWVLAVIGGVVILLGAYNIIITLIDKEQYGFLILGIIQILIGIGVLNEYHGVGKKSEKNEPHKKSEDDFGKWWKKQKIWEKVIIIIGAIIIGIMVIGLILGV